MLKDMRHSWCLHRLKHPIIQPWGKRPILSISQPLFYFSYCFPLNSLTSYCIILCSAIYLHWVHRTPRWVPRGSLLNERQHVLPLSVWQSARWRELRPPLLISTLDPLHASRRVEEVKRSLTDNVNEQEDYGDDLSLKSAHPPIMLPALHPSSSTVVAGNPTPWTGGLYYVGQPDNFRTFKSKLFFLWKMCGATTWYWGLHPSIHPSIHPQSLYFTLKLLWGNNTNQSPITSKTICLLLLEILLVCVSGRYIWADFTRFSQRIWEDETAASVISPVTLIIFDIPQDDGWGWDI